MFLMRLRLRVLFFFLRGLVGVLVVHHGHRGRLGRRLFDCSLFDFGEAWAAYSR